MTKWLSKVARQVKRWAQGSDSDYEDRVLIGLTLFGIMQYQHSIGPACEEPRKIPSLKA